MSRYDYDVIVVGCGPAGMTACAKLAAQGVRVLGIDKKPKLDTNIRTASGYCFLDQPFNAEFITRTPLGGKTRLDYTDTGFSVTYGGDMEGIHHSHMFSDTGKHWQASTTRKPFYHIFNPHQCHADRYRWALSAGAEFLSATLCINLRQDGDGVTVLVRRDGKDRRLSCRKLIAADGLSSRIAKISGANAPRTNFGMKGPTIEYELANVDCPYDRGDMFFFGAKNFGGRAGGIIMVPSCHGDGVFRMETMSVLPASTAADLIEYFTKEGPFASWFRKAEIIETSGCIVEFLSPMLVPHLGNILFAGDSAAYGECLYQSATMAGYKGAQCVLDELDGKPGFETFTSWWGDHFEWVRNPKRMADYTKRVLFPRFFSVQELDFLFELSEKRPIILEEAEATPYDFTTMVMQAFMAMPEVTDELRQRMQFIIDADMTQVAQVVGQVQKA